MKRSTVDFGIDLGTTNSSIAAYNGTTTEILKNEDNSETTPSAVTIDAKGRVMVGRQAKDRVELDPENAFQEFKRQMGKADPRHFKASGRKMLPEELSAEVLKDLRKNVTQSLSEDINAAVITVPADFDGAQVEATNRAATLAGLKQCVMLMEPVAAAMAYGFDKRPEKSRWLVYDFGGGTFDAAIIETRDGIIQVRDHAGDKYLGGKNIDEAIIDTVLAPAVIRQLRLVNFQRGREEWRAAFAKLKNAAETAKIRLSRAPSAIIRVDNIDGRGSDFEYELSRETLEDLARPFIERSISLCRQAMRQQNLGAGDVSKVLLVGGPTLMPVLRQMVADEKVGLGISLEFNVDPFTVVARGAAVFAATQPLHLPEGGPAKGEYHVKLDYSAIGPDTDPQVVGQVLARDTQTFSAWTIEFINTTHSFNWRSGKLGLTPDGRFMATLDAEKDKNNVFKIQLTDGTGVPQKTTPESFPYRVTTGVDPNPPLIHDVGIALADNKVGKFFAKGAPLPARFKKIYRTAATAKAGEANTQLIKVPVLQGNYPRADRNTAVGSLDIPVSKLNRDLPAGTEVEVTIEIDTSRRFHTQAYIPALGDDGEFSITIDKPKHSIAYGDLDKQVKAAKNRLDELKAQAKEKGDPAALDCLDQIERERLSSELSQCAEAARHDEDAADRADSLRRDLDAKLDEVEAALAWPKLVAEAEQNIVQVRQIVQDHGSPEDKQALNVHVSEVQEGIRSRDEVVLRHCMEELNTLRILVLRKVPQFWAAVFLSLEKDAAKFSSHAEATGLFAEGRRAILNSNLEALQGICQQLFALEPSAGGMNPGDIMLH